MEVVDRRSNPVQPLRVEARFRSAAGPLLLGALVTSCVAGLDAADAGDRSAVDEGEGQATLWPPIDGGPLTVTGCTTLSGTHLAARVSTITSPPSCAVLLYRITRESGVDGGWSSMLANSGVTAPCQGSVQDMLMDDAGFDPVVYWKPAIESFEISVRGLANGRPVVFAIDGGGTWASSRALLDGGPPQLRAYRIEGVGGAFGLCRF